MHKTDAASHCIIDLELTSIDTWHQHTAERALTSKEEEDSPLHGAKHGDKALPNDECEEHVHSHIEGARSSTDLQRLNLTASTDQISRLRTGKL